jgi:hypothetical protein
MVALLEKMMSVSVLCLQLEDRLVAIPTQNIRCAELLPTPDHLPEAVIHNAKRVHRLH